MAAPSKYGAGKYSYDLYSFHIQSTFAVGSPSWTADIKRVRLAAATNAVGSPSWTAGIKRVRLVASVAALPVVGWTGTAYRVRLAAGSMDGMNLGFAASLSGDFIIGSSFSVSAGVGMSGDLQVEKFWTGITNPGSDWSNQVIPDGGWAPIETPTQWN